MNRILPVILSVVFLLIIPSCDNKLPWQQTIKKMSGKQINFNWDKQYIFNDTVIRNDDCIHVPVKIVSVIDDNLCDSCLANYLTGASIFMDRLHTDSVVFFAVVKSKSDFKLRNILRRIDSQYCAIIQDSDGVFCDINSLKDNNARINRTFLLDACNKIVLCGDPLLNYKLEQLYIKTIKNLTQRGGVIDGENNNKVKNVQLESDAIKLGKIYVDKPSTFSTKFRNANIRPISVVVEPECDCTTVFPNDFTISSKSGINVKGSIVVDKEGPFEKYLYVRMKGRDDFQTIVIKGTAVLN